MIRGDEIIRSNFSLDKSIIKEWESMADHDLLIEIRTNQEWSLKIMEDMEARIRMNERWRWKSIGIAIGLTLTSGFGVGTILKLMGVI